MANCRPCCGDALQNADEAALAREPLLIEEAKKEKEEEATNSLCASCSACCYRWCGFLCCGLLIFLVCVASAMLGCVLAGRQPVQTLPLIDKDLGGQVSLTVSTLPVPQNEGVIQGLRAAFTDYSENVQKVSILPAPWKFGTASTQTVIQSMYTATRVPGVFEQAPEVLRGVFWMRGNGLPEPLVSVQYGRWFPDERIWVMPTAPFSWTWTLDKPDQAPFMGFLHKPEVGAFSSGFMEMNLQSFSFKFNDAMTFAQMAVHPQGDLRVDALADGYYTGTRLFTGDYSMEDISPPGQRPGTVWRRTVRWGVGSCLFVDFGSYQLTKIWDANGAPIEPYYTEFLEYMAGKSQYLWTGDGARRPQQEAGSLAPVPAPGLTPMGGSSGGSSPSGSPGAGTAATGFVQATQGSGGTPTSGGGSGSSVSVVGFVVDGDTDGSVTDPGAVLPGDPGLVLVEGSSPVGAAGGSGGVALGGGSSVVAGGSGVVDAAGGSSPVVAAGGSGAVVAGGSGFLVAGGSSTGVAGTSSSSGSSAGSFAATSAGSSSGVSVSAGVGGSTGDGGIGAFGLGGGEFFRPVQWIAETTTTTPCPTP